MTRLRAMLLAMRPKTLTAGIAPVVLGTAVAHVTGGVRPLVALAALVGALGIQIGTNLFNDYEDFRRGADTADRLGPARATQQGWLSAHTVKRMALAAFGVAALAGVYLVTVAGWPIVAIGLTSLVSGWLYTGGPYPLAYVGAADGFVFVFFGLVAVGGTTYAQTLSWPTEAWLAGAGIGALSTAILVVNNLRDRHTDARAGKRSLAVRFGPRFARAQYAALLALSFAIPAVGAVRGQLGWLAALGALPLAAAELRGVLQTDGAALNARLAGTARVTLVYALLLSVGIVL